MGDFSKSDSISSFMKGVKQEQKHHDKELVKLGQMVSSAGDFVWSTGSSRPSVLSLPFVSKLGKEADWSKDALFREETVDNYFTKLAEVNMAAEEIDELETSTDNKKYLKCEAERLVPEDSNLVKF